MTAAYKDHHSLAYNLSEMGFSLLGLSVIIIICHHSYQCDFDLSW